MAHRSGVGDGSATFASRLFFRTGPLLALATRGACKPEEGQTVPASAGDRNGDRAERGIMPVLMPESLREDLHQNRAPLPFPGDQSARQRQPPIWAPPILTSCRLAVLAAPRKEASSREDSQVAILRDLVGPP